MEYFSSIVTTIQKEVEDNLPISTCNVNIASLVEVCQNVSDDVVGGYQKMSENVVEVCQNVSEDVVDSYKNVSENMVEVYQNVADDVVDVCQKVSDDISVGYQNVTESVEIAIENFKQAIVIKLSTDEINEINGHFDDLNIECSDITETLSSEQIEEFLDSGVKVEAQKALQSLNTPFWNGVEWFLDWLRENFKQAIQNKLSELPVVGKWATRVGTSVSELVFTVFSTAVGFLKVVLTSPTMWKKANDAATKTWNDNVDYGVLVQTYGYGKKMATYFLEIIKQCLERAIKARGLQVSSDEKDDITDLLDNLLL